MKPSSLRKSPTYWLTNRKQIFGLAAACSPVSECDGQSVGVYLAKALLLLGDLACHSGRKECLMKIIKGPF